MSGQVPPGGGSRDGRDEDDPFAVRPASDADRERPRRTLPPAGWGLVPGADPAPAEPAPARGDDILAGIVPLDPTAEEDHVAPLDQAEAAADAGEGDPAEVAPEPEIAPDTVHAGDVDLPTAPAPGISAAHTAEFAYGGGEPEVLSGEIVGESPDPEPEPSPAEAASELVLEPVNAESPDSGAPTVEEHPVDAVVVEDPPPSEPEPVAGEVSDDTVELTPRRDEEWSDDDAEVVDDAAAAGDAPTADAPNADAIGLLFGSVAASAEPDAPVDATRVLPAVSGAPPAPPASDEAPASAEAPASPAAAGPSPRRGSRRPRRTLLWVAGAIVLALVLVGLFFLGQRLASTSVPDGPMPAPAPVEAPTPTPSPTPTPTPAAAAAVQGPAAPGAQAWNALLGGECLEPFVSPWEEKFTVVDCGTAHHAQMVARVALPQDTDTFPGEDAVRASADEICARGTVIDYAAARAYTDVQYQSAYPVTPDEWAKGERDAYCFVSRAGGGTLTKSIGVPQPAVVP